MTSPLHSPGQAPLYCPFYCEENIWQLCRQLKPETSAWVLFISNHYQSVAMCYQKAAPPNQILVWDYHVILLELPGPHSDSTSAEANPRIWDFDTHLDFPYPAIDYLQQSFPAIKAVGQHYRPRFRPIPAQEYLEAFSSDRSHMNKSGEGWIHPPPQWPMIQPTNKLREDQSPLTLEYLRDFSNTTTLDFDGLLHAIQSGQFNELPSRGG